ncbi:hypothetical protein EPHNCH_0795 [Anaplasma phagocytophilum str. NCH-1]|uniref:Uncharacterized protein n=1 Tax=Anaplasma phagocytophilum str. NCH-1 TaxID=1359161 RepID=A0A0F3NCL3_ANAPH|nr:hypothetical protein EPHNCH_0795 [Anaplasma phagocytophilum str. NCH-1]
MQYPRSISKKYSDPTEKQSCAALLCQKNFTGAKIRTQTAENIPECSILS